MNAVGRGWRRFRRLPGALQAATWIGVVAAYSLVLVFALGGGDGDDHPEERSVGAVLGGKARPMTEAERKIARLVEGAGAGKPGEATDVQRFRLPHVRTVTCSDGCRTVEVLYSVGLPGTGRILSDQRLILERLFSRTEVVKAVMTVTRDVAVAGVPPKAGEETPTGAPLLTTTCDRSKQPGVDWGTARGAQILHNICKAGGYDQGQIHRQETVAPGDETAGDLEPDR